MGGGNGVAVVRNSGTELGSQRWVGGLREAGEAMKVRRSCSCGSHHTPPPLLLLPHPTPHLKSILSLASRSSMEQILSLRMRAAPPNCS